MTVRCAGCSKVREPAVWVYRVSTLLFSLCSSCGSATGKRAAKVNAKAWRKAEAEAHK